MSSKPIRILVLDDEEVVRNNLRAFFEDEGFEVLLAAEAEEALKLLTKKKADVAVVDLRLPVMTGSEFITRAHQEYPAMKFIIYTGSPEFTLTPTLAEAGMQTQEIILKPLFDMKRFTEAIDRLLGRKK